MSEKAMFLAPVEPTSSNKFQTVPTVQSCYAHLLLLNAFHSLRQHVSSRDGLFGLNDGDIVSAMRDAASTNPSSKDVALQAIAEKRWAVYVARAAWRFERWWKHIAQSSGAYPLKNADLAALDESVSLAPSTDSSNSKSLEYLPPLDILMCWHAFMLNPRCYLEDCLRQGMLGMFHTSMPWNSIQESIDPITGAYNPGPKAMKRFEVTVRLRWDNLEDADKVEIECPNSILVPPLSHTILVPWTTCGAWLRGGHSKRAADLETIIAQGDGFADRNFNTICATCSHDVNHSGLRAAKFNRDMGTMLLDSVPMPGTFLSNDGRAEHDGKRYSSGEPRLFPNALLSHSAPIMSRFGEWRTVEAIRDDIEKVLGIIRGHRRILREERMSVRKMMSRYWSNSSPFALDLVGAVIRQGGFITKMQSIDWLHSPEVRNTLAHLCIKYKRFFHMMADYPDHMAVPTLDVDLCWHTHQLSPAQYYAYSITKTRGIFIDHDDKVAETKLSIAFAETSKLYQKLYGEPYSLCLCWYCESVRAGHSSITDRLFRRSSISVVESALASAPSDPEKCAHISAHNAFRPTTATPAYTREIELHERKLVADHDKACRMARKHGRPEPVLDRKRCDNDGTSYAGMAAMPFGMAMYVPMVYVSTPACANFAVGASGNCASGSCGGGVAAGAFGACAGGAVGGAGGACASAGGGSACGGGGGGGGGCGGGGGGGGC